MAPLRIPPAIKPGDAVSLVAPSGPVDAQALDRAVEVLQQRSIRINTYGDLTRRRGYLAGSDEERADEFNQAARDPETVAVLPVRGGYGAGRIVDRIDYEAIARRPKLFCGFSDITILHAAIHRRAGVATFHGPNLQDGIGSIDGLHPVASGSYWQALTGSGELVAPPHEPRVLVPGRCEGPVVGGNLAVLGGMIGTPWEVDTHGAILMIEDVGEAPYRVDRMLAQMRLAGKLDAVCGIVIGQFTDCTANKPDKSCSLKEIFEDYFASLGVPVLMDYPVGHVRLNQTIPLGIPLELDTEKTQLDLPRAYATIAEARAGAAPS